MSSLLTAIGSAETVTISRLANPKIREALTAANSTIVELPHIGCKPVTGMLQGDTLRIRSWPNLGGVLEPGTAEDVVVWWPCLAKEPDVGNVLRLDALVASNVEERTQFLVGLLKRLGQNRGIAAACTPQAPRAILYTFGIPRPEIQMFEMLFPGALSLTPRRLAEFPGGLSITVTPGAWLQREMYAETLNDLLRRHTR